MREVVVGDVAVRLEAGEAGGRYLAPILIVPGLFQSWVCWRGMTSMLAHRGWDVYLLPRLNERDGSLVPNRAEGWSAAVETASRVTRELSDKVILFGADVGAAIALATLERAHPLALALFAPVDPAVAGKAFEQSLGFFARRRARASTEQAVEPPPTLAKQVHRKTDSVAEPAALMRDLTKNAAFRRPAEHPPAIVFAPQEDPLVEREDAIAFTPSPYAKLARTPLVGRWWPSSRWEPVADEVHRFLILTLADRVVEFPEEILED